MLAVCGPCSLAPTRKRFARLPQRLRRRVIVRGGRGLYRFALDEIPPRHVRDLWRRGEVDDGVGALFWGDREPLSERRQPSSPAAGRAAETGGDKAGMKAVCGDAGPGETTDEFGGKQDVGEFRAPVGLEPTVSFGSRCAADAVETIRAGVEVSSLSPSATVNMK